MLAKGARRPRLHPAVFENRVKGLIEAKQCATTSFRLMLELHIESNHSELESLHAISTMNLD